jgi:hypothetical protein
MMQVAIKIRRADMSDAAMRQARASFEVAAQKAGVKRYTVDWSLSPAEDCYVVTATEVEDAAHPHARD